MTMADDSESPIWNVELEIALLHAMRRHKPAGVNKHFQMACIVEKMNSAITSRICVNQVWAHLRSMYDLQALNESENIPFPNKENDFKLPSYEFSSLLNQSYPRCPESIPCADDEHAKEKEGGGKTTRNKLAQVVASTTKPVSTLPSQSPSAQLAAKQLLAQTLMEDSPKRDQRKRTRGQISTPTSNENTPTGKRARRT